MSEYIRRNKKLDGGSMPKEEYIMLINKELNQINSEHYFRIIYLLIKKCKEEGN